MTSHPLPPGRPGTSALQDGAGTTGRVTAEEDRAGAAYQFLVRDPKPSVTTLVAAGHSPREASELIDTLVSRGLVVRGEGGTVTVPPPELTLPEYAARLEDLARTTRAATAGIARAYLAARGEAVTRSFDVQLLSSASEVEEARVRLTAAAHRDVIRGLARCETSDTWVFRQAEAFHRSGRILRSHTSRVLVDSSFLEVEGAFDALTTLVDQGVHVRLVPNVASNILVVDRAAALVDLTHVDPSGHGSAVVRHPPLVEVIARLIESAFRHAPPLPSRDVNDGDTLLDPRDVQILTLLATGATDTTIAKQLRVSQRTVERRLRALMDHLGASTRFQTGVLAARRGLV